MFSLNKVTLVGRVGNVEIRGTDKKVASIAFYTTESWKDKEGNWQNRDQRHTLTEFQPGRVKLFENHIKKGSRLYVEGSIAYGKFTDNDGVERYTAEIVVSDVQFIDPKNSESGTSETDGSD